jgi:hypothetical protein
MLALMHGQFSAAMLDFLEQRPRNAASPFAAVEMCAVATGLLFFLKATSHGQCLNPVVCEIDRAKTPWPSGHT